MAVGPVAPFGVLLEAGFQIGPQLGQTALVAGLLGEGVVQGRQFLGFELNQADLEFRRATGRIRLGIGLGELAGHRAAVAGFQADDPLDEAGNHAALFEFHLHALGAAAHDRLAGVAVGAAEAHFGHIATGGGPALHGHQRCQLLAGLVQQLIDPGGVVVDRFRFGFEALGGLEAGAGFHIQLQGEAERVTRFEARQHHLKGLAQLGLADRLDLLLADGLAENAVHQIFESRGLDAQGADLLEQHRPGHLALAEARQLDAAAEFGQGGVIAGLAAGPRYADLHRQSAARAGAGADLQRGAALARGGWGLGGFGAGGGRTHERGRSSRAARDPRKWCDRRPHDRLGRVLSEGRKRSTYSQSRRRRQWAEPSFR